jgi:hypothetical protein
MVFLQVEGSQDFEWLKNVRYYWDQEIDNCIVCMSNSRYIYNYEYLGASARLVITPLTVSIVIEYKGERYMYIVVFPKRISDNMIWRYVLLRWCTDEHSIILDHICNKYCKFDWLLTDIYMS